MGQDPPVSALIIAAVLGSLALVSAPPGSAAQVFRNDHGAEGDTVDLTKGAKVRLVQLETTEVYFRPQCYGRQASTLTKRLLPQGTLARLTTEPATDRVNNYGRLLRYVIRARDGLNVNVRLVAVGAAAPYFYEGRRGRYANRLKAGASRPMSARVGARHGKLTR
jgi:endonuclease YncB( thermonuclease family)